MSVRLVQKPIRWVHCNQPNCTAAFEADPGASWDSFNARWEAKRYGWDVPPVRGQGSRSEEDYCPGHHRGGYRGKPTPAQVKLLRRAAKADLRLQPGARLSEGHSSATFDALIGVGLVDSNSAGWVTLTPSGQAVLSEIDASEGEES